MSCNNGPQFDPRKVFTVSAVIPTPAIVTLIVNRLFADLPQNSEFFLCLQPCTLPRNNTGIIVITDGVLVMEARGWNGNFLRNDSLRGYGVKRICNECGTIRLHAFKGNDPLHVTVFNRMCASSAPTAEVAPPEIFSAGVPAASAPASVSAKKATVQAKE